jgi:hypothetical protein
MSIVATTGRRGQPCSEDGPPQTTPTVRPTIPESADRIEREPAGRKPAVVPVEAAGSPVEVGVPWPVAEAHPALRRIATSDIADARRRSVLVPRAIWLLPCESSLCPAEGHGVNHTPTTARRRFRHRRFAGGGLDVAVLEQDKRACGDGRRV